MAFDSTPEIPRKNAAQRRAEQYGAIYSKITTSETPQEPNKFAGEVVLAEPGITKEPEEIEESLESVEDVESDIELDSPDSIDRLCTYAETMLKERAAQAGISVEDFARTDAAQALEEFTDLLEGMKVAAQEEALTNRDGEIVQSAFDRLLEADLDVVQEAEETFDPSAYVAEHLDDNLSVKASERTQVMFLQESYDLAVQNGNTNKAEKLAKQIKDHVDELIGNDQIPEEGSGADLTLERKSTELQLENLDAAEENIKVYPAANSLEYLMQVHGEEAGRDLYESRQVVKNLRAETEKASEKEPPEAAEIVEPAQVEEVEVVVSEELSPEEQLKKDLAEYGVENLEPELSEEVYVEPDEVEDVESKTQSNSFAPSAEQEQQRSVREAALGEKEHDIKFKNEIKGIERLGNGGLFSWLANNGQSPYEVLSEMNFEDIVLSSQFPYVKAAERTAYLKHLTEDLKVDQMAFENWMKLLPEIQDLGIETNGKTFKEVADDLIEARIGEGNTQST